MSKETLRRPKIKEMQFKPEGYPSTGDQIFLDEFAHALEAEGYNPKELVYSGFDGTEVSKGAAAPRHDYIFGMNLAAWREAIKFHEPNPAQYAEGWETPTIALYDSRQLARVYSSEFDLQDVNDRIELSDIRLGENLADLDQDTPVEEALVHKNYPEESPTDALIGLVYLSE